VALDGDGSHSPFTTALLRHIETPGVEIGLMMRRVTKDVFESTKEKQRPWTNASLTGEFYMKPGEPAAAPAPGPAPAAAAPAPGAGFDERQMELAFWQSADKSGAAGDYEEYLKRYPNGQFAGMAKNRLEALKNKPNEPRTATADPGPGQGRSVDAANTSKNSDEASELAIGLTANDRVGIQRRLLLAGINPNGVDGSFGPGTRRAISTWQTSRGFNASGFLNRDQYGALIAQTETAYANWLASERARVAATPQPAAPSYPQPSAQPAPTAQPAPSRGPSARDVIDGASGVRDMIRIFR
jgi:peptidoglycan hydrolase-like protein with peptidoglycan-binding domain